MFVEDIASRFRQYADEPDQTWVTPTDVANYCRNAYDQFRRIVVERDPYMHAVRRTADLTNVFEYDLASAGNPLIIMGPTPNNQPLQRLLGLECIEVDTVGTLRFRMRPVHSLEELDQYRVPGNLLIATGREPVYFLQGSSILFSFQFTGRLRVTYVGYPSRPRFATGIDWTRQSVGDNEFIDDLDEFHDLIALLACQEYAIRDHQTSEELQRQIAVRKHELDAFLGHGRDVEASGTISMVW